MLAAPLFVRCFAERDGRIFPWQCKVRRYSDDHGAQRYFIELRCVLLHLYHRDTDMLVHRKIKEHRGAWAVLLDRVGLDIADNLLPSARAAEAVGVEHPCIAQEHQASPQLVIVLLLHAQANVRRRDDQAFAGKLLESLLDACGVAESDQSSVAPHRLGLEARSGCPQFDRVDNACPHLVDYAIRLGKVDVQGSAKAILVAFALALLYLDSCSAVRVIFVSGFEAVCKRIEAHFGCMDGGKAVDQVQHFVVGGRKRRVDEDYKASLAEEVSGGAARTMGALLRARGLSDSRAQGWVEEHMAGVRASLLLSFDRPQNVGICFDASRLGNPSEETLMVQVTDGDRHLGAWFPPQVVRTQGALGAETGGGAGSGAIQSQILELGPYNFIHVHTLSYPICSYIPIHCHTFSYFGHPEQPKTQTRRVSGEFGVCGHTFPDILRHAHTFSDIFIRSQIVWFPWVLFPSEHRKMYDTSGFVGVCAIPLDVVPLGVKRPCQHPPRPVMAPLAP